jgi:hypothetical protein
MEEMNYAHVEAVKNIRTVVEEKFKAVNSAQLAVKWKKLWGVFLEINVI